MASLNYIMHIPKTAGMSLQALVRRRHKKKGSLSLIYTQKAIESGFEDTAELQTLMGHFRYGFHQYSPRPARYFTFLRNPIDQLISHYYYSLEKPEKFEDLPQGITNVIDFAKCAYGYNLQTRFVSGMDHIMGNETEALALARKNLKDEFELVGITEEFDLSIIMLAHNLNWPLMFYTNENKGKQRQLQEDISEGEKQLLKEILKTDIALYQYGLELFNCQVNNIGSLNYKLKKFRYQNRLFQWLNPSYIRFKKLMGWPVEDIHKPSS